ncbi:hypothetical protein ANCCEY_01534 [Ancylostoma ceylanicum]|uniref:Uncharacterized protein n=1 Tax=Ancylostoma ceylanicum TaxID=53326 RepID=A0A0D6M5J4_9BILA|nr:hypothetical protein ANCCEY_01534 [Ancylostoma ceylanicum]
MIEEFSALSYTTQPPCCRDHIGASTCQRLHKSYPRMFSRRCNTDVEFRYVNSTDVFEPQRTWTCEGENPQIAFRACRKSCGFCDLSAVDYTLEKAENACKDGGVAKMCEALRNLDLIK